MTNRPPGRRRLRTVLTLSAASALVVGVCVGGLAPAAVAATTPTPAPSASTSTTTATTTTAKSPLQQLLDAIAAALKKRNPVVTPTASATPTTSATTAPTTPATTAPTAAPTATATPKPTATPTPTATPAVVNKPVVVSLTFDDGDADQIAAASTLAANGFKGTFYINSGFLGAAGYMTQADVKNLYAAGNEIGGHTVSHPDLPTISAAEAKRQICLDRVNLTNILGVNAVTSFAYPFASENASVESIVSSCGYNSARGLGDLKSPYSCTTCAPAETIPPAKPMITAAMDEVESTWSLADLQSGVKNAQAKGGWVQYTFHHVCPAGATCADPTMSSALFTSFVQWLKTTVGTTGSNVTVKTVGQVINKPAKAVVAATYPAAAGAGVNAIASNPSLETFDALYNNPTCFQQGGYGANTPAFSWAGAAHTGTKAETLTVSNYADGDAKLLPILDLGQCAPTVVPAHTYSLREWYTSNVVTQFAVYLRDATGKWTYWTSSPWFAASDTYALASWTTPAIPAGSTGLSYGLNLFSNGTLVTDDWAMYDSVGAPAITPAAVSTTEVVPNTATLVPDNAEKKGTVQVPDAVTTGGGETATQ